MCLRLLCCFACVAFVCLFVALPVLVLLVFVRMVLSLDCDCCLLSLIECMTVCARCCSLCFVLLDVFLCVLLFCWLCVFSRGCCCFLFFIFVWFV